LQSLTSSTDATNYTSTTYQPTASRLLLAFIATRGGTANPLTITGNGVTWTNIAAINGITDGRLMVYAALSGAAPTNTGLYVEYNGVTQTAQLMSIMEVSGAWMFGGAAGAVAAATTGVNAAATSGYLPVANPANPANALVTAFAHVAAEAATQNAALTEVHDVNAATPATALETCYTTALSTVNTTAAWSFFGGTAAATCTNRATWTSSVVSAIISVEIKASTYTAKSDQTLVYTCDQDTWIKIAGAASGNPALDPDFKLEGTQVYLGLSGGTVTPTDVGINVRLASTFSGAALHFFHWRALFSPANMSTKANQGVCLWISDEDSATPTDYKRWYLDGNDTDLIGGWRCYVIDLNATPDATNGTTTMTAIKSLGFVHRQLTAIATKYPNTGVDAGRIGTGLVINDGHGLTPVSFTNVYANDSAPCNMFGVVGSANSVFYLGGKLYIGTSTQTNPTYFKDASQVIVFKNYPVNPTFYEIQVVGNSTYKTCFKLGEYSPVTGLVSGGVVVRGGGIVTGTTHAIWILTASDANQVSKLYGATLSEMASAALAYNTVSSVVSCTTNGTAAVTTTASLYTNGVVKGMSVSGTNITGGTYVASVDSDTGLTLTQIASGSGTQNLTYSHSSEWRSVSVANSGTVTTNGCLINNCVFQDLKIGAPISATYGLIANSAVEFGRITNTKFINTGRAIKLTAAGDYTASGLTFSGNAYDIENSVTATTADSYATTNRDTDVNLNSTTGISAVGNTFDGNTEKLASCQFYLKKAGTPSGTMVAKLYLADGSSPKKPTGGALATSGTLVANTALTTTLALVEFTFTAANCYQLSAGSAKYVIVLEYTAGTGTDYVIVGYDGSSPTDGGYVEYVASAWTGSAAKELCYYVYTGAIIVIGLSGGSNPSTAINTAHGSTTFTSSVTLAFVVTNADGDPIDGVYVYIDDNDQQPYILNTTTAGGGLASVGYTAGVTPNSRWRARKYGYKQFVQYVDIGATDVTLYVTLAVDPQQI